MTQTPFNGSSIEGLPDEDRLLLAAGLAHLCADMTDAHPLLERIDSMRALLRAGTVLEKAPRHVDFNEPELQEMISYLNGSEYWTVYWEYGSHDHYDLVGEVAVNGEKIHFGLADNLEGDTGLALAKADALFVSRLCEYVRLWAPTTTDELHVAAIEIPMSWTAFDGMRDDGDLLESYLGSITSEAGVSGVMTREAHGDVHSNGKLEEQGYAAVTTLAIGSRRQLDALPAILSDYERSLSHAPSSDLKV